MLMKSTRQAEGEFRAYEALPFRTTHRRRRDKHGGGQVRAMFIAENNGVVLYRARYGEGKDYKRTAEKIMTASKARWDREFR